MEKILAALEKRPISDRFRRWCIEVAIPQLPNRKLTDAEAWELIVQILERHRSHQEYKENLLKDD